LSFQWGHFGIIFKLTEGTTGIYFKIA
jgi:hypothetical protein